MAKFKTRPLEKIIRRAPLALRFVDLTQNRPVTDGLRIVAWRTAAPHPQYPAYHSLQSGIYGYSHLPGFRRFEPDNGTEAGPEPEIQYVILVRDDLDRFLPQTLVLNLPRQEVFSVELFSTPARAAPAGYASIFGEIRDVAKGKPASWAVITATIPGVEDEFAGVADERGMFSLFLPYIGAFPKPPTDEAEENNNTSGQPRPQLNDLEWDLNFSVKFRRTSQATVKSDIPDIPPTIKSILKQEPAEIINDEESNLVLQISRTLRFKRPLVVATMGRERLQIQPTTS